MNKKSESKKRVKDTPFTQIASCLEFIAIVLFFLFFPVWSAILWTFVLFLVVGNWNYHWNIKPKEKKND